MLTERGLVDTIGFAVAVHCRPNMRLHSAGVLHEPVHTQVLLGACVLVLAGVDVARAAHHRRVLFCGRLYLLDKAVAEHQRKRHRVRTAQPPVFFFSFSTVKTAVFDFLWTRCCACGHLQSNARACLNLSNAHGILELHTKPRTTHHAPRTTHHLQPHRLASTCQMRAMRWSCRHQRSNAATSNLTDVPQLVICTARTNICTTCNLTDVLQPVIRTVLPGTRLLARFL
jgi:hypothetical protein